MNIIRIKYSKFKMNKEKIYSLVTDFYNDIVLVYDLEKNENEIENFKKDLGKLPELNENFNLSLNYGNKDINFSFDEVSSMLKINESKLEDTDIQKIQNKFIEILINNFSLKNVESIAMQFSTTIQFETIDNNLDDIKKYFSPSFLMEYEENLNQIDSVYTYREKDYLKKIAFIGSDKKKLNLIVQYIYEYDVYKKSEIGFKLLKNDFTKTLSFIQKKMICK